MSVDDTLQFIAYEDIFWAMKRPFHNPNMRKVELRGTEMLSRRIRPPRFNFAVPFINNHAII
jgi:hypothetical protein